MDCLSPGQNKEVTTGLNGSRKTYFNLWRVLVFPALLDHLIELLRSVS